MKGETICDKLLLDVDRALANFEYLSFIPSTKWLHTCSEGVAGCCSQEVPVGHSPEVIVGRVVVYRLTYLEHFCSDSSQ